MKSFPTAPSVLLALLLSVYVGAATRGSNVAKFCCFQFSHRFLPWNLVRTYEFSRNSCSLPAVMKPSPAACTTLQRPGLWGLSQASSCWLMESPGSWHCPGTHPGEGQEATPHPAAESQSRTLGLTNLQNCSPKPTRLWTRPKVLPLYLLFILSSWFSTDPFPFIYSPATLVGGVAVTASPVHIYSTSQLAALGYLNILSKAQISTR
ncbi:C-C motif chemokine 26 isoform X1 [Choloepus didactylus]|uniref:C-C motif chemokine 26 isoform X1 n=1 Tax=Choloepus didactylus TaxID=27675 RepID=UPI00189DA076|nr:C-C motif chemokine 26 isoform X1 [Choloepus didactylus]